uniref:Uncharacterized protein n=1 Tax=Octopus bimaculoides TaxID=37653 RepID=A0A0L8HU23_OCTBM
METVTMDNRKNMEIIKKKKNLKYLCLYFRC